MHGRTPAAAAVIALLFGSVLVPSPAAPTLLTIPQQDRIRSTAGNGAVSVSADGRYLALTSYARLAAGDTDDYADIYVLDLSTNSVTLESAPGDGLQLAGDCDHPSVSADGRYVAFESAVVDSANGAPVTDVLLRDRVTGTTRRISAGPRGVKANGWSSSPAISASGKAVAFTSAATNLVANHDVNGSQPDIYLFELDTGTMRRVSVDSTGTQQPGGSVTPSITADGRTVAFSSAAALTSDSTGSAENPAVFVRHVSAGRTVRVAPAIGRPNGASAMPAISADGNTLAFVSRATNLAPGDRNRSSDVFLYDVATRAVTLVSRTRTGGAANGASSNPAISGDGRFVLFQSEASDLACPPCPPDVEDINLVSDVFVFDRTTGQVACVSAGTDGSWMEESGAPAVDASGQVVAFTSRHPISPRDTGHDFDLFVRVDR